MEKLGKVIEKEEKSILTGAIFETGVYGEPSKDVLKTCNTGFKNIFSTKQITKIIFLW